MNLILIRHGDPDYANDTLTPKGRDEAIALAKFLKNLSVTKFYCSPMGRARDTVAPTLSFRGERAQVLDWLEEFPECILDPDNGMVHVPWDLLPRTWTSVPELYDKDKWYNADIYKTGNAYEVYKNVCNGVDELLESYGYVREGNIYKAERPNRDTIVLVCHFGVICAVISHLIGISPVLLWQGAICPPTGITRLSTEERQEGIAYFRCNRFGDVSHLYLDGQRPSRAGRFRETVGESSSD
ncbi:MAG: histidine phosphatase family protein [Clostridia bacterium]|nr:histidine phosphatase family protein [Clostridia bacterium]